MVAVNRTIMPASIAPPAAAFAHAVLSEGSFQLLHTSGVVGTRPNGTVPEGVGEQAEVVWANILAILDEVDMSVSDIVSMTTYVVVGNPLGEVMAARDRALSGHLAASTLLPVPALARPEWQIEIAVVAAR
jgi:enamine deaminase RidA (YjgF/YER057c/UK114 family)